MEGVTSRASSRGRSNGVSAPKRLAVAAISPSSVETTTRSGFGHLAAASIVQAMRGLLARGARFLRGIDLDPPRAGISASVEACAEFNWVEWILPWRSARARWRVLKLTCDR